MKLVHVGWLLAVQSILALRAFQEVFRWKQLDFDWPSETVRNRIIAANGFEPINNGISGIKVWGTNIYLTIPRFRPGIPVTLARISALSRAESPKLKAYPSYEMQIIGDCDAFQHVQSMEIDPLGRMWVVDSGRVDLLTENPQPLCPPKLVVLDLENGGREVLKYEFPDDVVNHELAFLNDIVLDSEDGGFAYMPDTSALNPGIVVYSVAQNKSWKVTDKTMFFEADHAELKINDQVIDMPFPIDGIALSPIGDKERYVYYCALSGHNLYSLPTGTLKKNLNPAKSAKTLGSKTSPSDGLMMTADGRLFFGLNAENAVGMWPRRLGTLKETLTVVDQDRERLNWVDGLGICSRGDLWIVTNRLANYYNEDIDPEDYNFRVLKTPVGVKSYQYRVGV